jgi:hypothetical protein
MIPCTYSDVKTSKRVLNLRMTQNIDEMERVLHVYCTNYYVKKYKVRKSENWEILV